MISDVTNFCFIHCNSKRYFSQVYLKMMKKQEIPASGGPCQNSYRSRRAKGRSHS
jgi:hypothetical protein